MVAVWGRIFLYSTNHAGGRQTGMEEIAYTVDDHASVSDHSGFAWGTDGRPYAVSCIYI